MRYLVQQLGRKGALFLVALIVALLAFLAAFVAWVAGRPIEGLQGLLVAFLTALGGLYTAFCAGNAGEWWAQRSRTGPDGPAAGDEAGSDDGEDAGKKPATETPAGPAREGGG